MWSPEERLRAEFQLHERSKVSYDFLKVFIKTLNEILEIIVDNMANVIGTFTGADNLIFSAVSKLKLVSQTCQIGSKMAISFAFHFQNDQIQRCLEAKSMMLIVKSIDPKHNKCFRN